MSISNSPHNHASLTAILAVPVLLAVGQPMPACAKVPTLSISSDSDLRFGSFIVTGSGSRTVTAAGMVTDVAIIPAGQGDTGPARFTVSYDRGNENKHILNLVIEVVLSSVPRVVHGGVSAQLGQFVSDIPGGANVQPGSPIVITIPNCTTRVCSRTFALGGRLDLVSQFGGATFQIPLPIDARLRSVD